MRPIDADALKEKLKTKDAAVMTLLGFFELIDEMPTIDVKECDIYGFRSICSTSGSREDHGR